MFGYQKKNIYNFKKCTRQWHASIPDNTHKPHVSKPSKLNTSPLSAGWAASKISWAKGLLGAQDTKYTFTSCGLQLDTSTSSDGCKIIKIKEQTHLFFIRWHYFVFHDYMAACNEYLHNICTLSLRSITSKKTSLLSSWSWR